MSKFGFQSVDSLLGADFDQSKDINTLRIEDLISFERHPFKVLDDEDMDDLVSSIKDNGVITPIVVRTLAHDEPKSYEIISGHRRVHAASKAGLKEVPAVIKEMSDDEATVLMVDSNMQRQTILPSERAYSLKMKYDALKHQGKRSDLTLAHDEPKLASAELGQSVGMSAAMVKRYIKLTELIPEIMERVDDKRISVNLGYQIAFISPEGQKLIIEFMDLGNKLDSNTVNNFKKMYEDGRIISVDDMERLLVESKKKNNRKFQLSESTIKKYFPEDYTEEQVEEIVMKLIENWYLHK